MSGDLAIGQVAAVSLGGQSRAPVATQPAAVQAPASASPAVSRGLPNPRFTVDPGLSRVVLEYFSDSGNLTNTVPSQQQLEAYRLAALSGYPPATISNVAA